MKHPCSCIAERIKVKCGQHTDAWQCPDVMIVWSNYHQEYGLPVRDGGSSYIAIKYCPWCGITLPSNRHETSL